jgi:ech hydrogenase subunit A
VEPTPLLIFAPIVAGILLALIKPEAVRGPLVYLLSAAVAAGSVWVAWRVRGEVGLPGGLDPHLAGRVFSGIETLVGLGILWVGFRSKNFWIVGLTLAQVVLMGWFEWGGGMAGGGHGPAAPMVVDAFTAIMLLINGVVGGAICVYAVGYMRAHHGKHHPERPDRRPLFFGVLFLFLGAMAGVVLSDNLLWLYFFWEITTVCSFLLIGYPATEEAKANARRALAMNLAGGLAFAAAVVWFHRTTGELGWRAMLAHPHEALGPAALICFAGITKAAQFPFSGWLLGAMVAPTPVSALLHSSAMVKAGVYAVVRMAPVIGGTPVGSAVAMVGAATFLLASFAAICTGDAKRVLAYSTVANLGLIVLCGGVGTHESMWAALLLIVFHAVAKCLLFLCVGVAEHGLHSRDIEAMSALAVRMRRLAVMMQVGMAGMFLAPFGMLISKWAVLKAVLDADPLFSLFIAFGSAATLFFWVKWMGKLLEVPGAAEPVRPEISAGEWVALWLLSAATFFTCLLFPLLSHYLVEPHVLAVYGQTASLGQGNVWIMLIMLGLVVLFPATFLARGKNVRMVGPYLAGANAEGGTAFTGSAGAIHEMGLRNYYLGDFIGEARMFRSGVWSGAFLAGALLVLAAMSSR